MKLEQEHHENLHEYFIFCHRLRPNLIRSINYSFWWKMWNVCAVTFEIMRFKRTWHLNKFSTVLEDQRSNDISNKIIQDIFIKN